MKLIYLKSTLKCDSFDVAIGIKIPFFRVLVTIEPGCSLLQFVTTNCLICGVKDFSHQQCNHGACSNMATLGVVVILGTEGLVWIHIFCHKYLF